MDLDIPSTPIFIVSACLLGLKTRYDGKCKCDAKFSDFFKRAHLIPVCPEQLGGLTTPRTPADLIGGDGYNVLAGDARVITRDGHDVTHNFICGAEQVLKIVQMHKVDEIHLKSGSPSCGVGILGVTAALLYKHGYDLIEH